MSEPISKRTHDSPAVWEIHRRIGMSGGLFVNALLREPGHPLDPEQTKRMQVLHGDFFAEIADQVRPLPGAIDLLHTLSELEVPWAIATSGHMRSRRREVGPPDPERMGDRRFDPEPAGGPASASARNRRPLREAGAFRVYDDPADILRHLDEPGVRGT
jgi:hypothetical protein